MTAEELFRIPRPWFNALGRMLPPVRVNWGTLFHATESFDPQFLSPCNDLMVNVGSVLFGSFRSTGSIPPTRVRYCPSPLVAVAENDPCAHKR